MTMVPLQGNPSALKSYANRYSDLATAILSAAQRLDTFADDGATIGKSVDALRDRAKDAGRSIREVHPRYSETAEALKVYAVKLEDAQARANAAIAKADTADNPLPYYRHRRRDLIADELAAVLTFQSQEVKDQIAHDLQYVNNRIHSIEAEINAASAEYNAAVADREAAAQAAIAKIAPVLDQLNDSLLDQIQAGLEALGDFLATVAQWIENVLKAVITAVLLIIATFIALVVLVLLIIGLIALLLIALALIVVLVITVVIPAISTLLKLLPLIIKWNNDRELATPMPPRVPIDVKQEDYARAPGENPYKNIMDNNGTIDENGGTDSTHIEVVTVYGPDGKTVVGYRVVLPSTTDWEVMNGLTETPPRWRPAGDRGSISDLGSDITLMTTPSGVKGPYEKAVTDAILAAMDRDGTRGANVPVMMTGFSQGGILAGRMAADPNSPFNITAVFTGGASIDAFNIPPNVTVISMQHPGDVVPMLDLKGPHNAIGSPGYNTHDNWVTITADKESTPVGGVPYDEHSAVSYAATANHYVVPSTDSHLAELIENQSMFFSGHESVSIYSYSE
jgi:hypothetical protein